MNGPTQREWEELTSRVRAAEEDIRVLREWQARTRGIASVLGFLAGLVAAAVVTAVIRALGYT